ncbi:hypothetical protein HK104_002571, partial [Borealophlyctis nickersoniae]
MPVTPTDNRTVVALDTKDMKVFDPTDMAAARTPTPSNLFIPPSKNPLGSSAADSGIQPGPIAGIAGALVL